MVVPLIPVLEVQGQGSVLDALHRPADACTAASIIVPVAAAAPTDTAAVVAASFVIVTVGIAVTIVAIAVAGDTLVGLTTMMIIALSTDFIRVSSLNSLLGSFPIHHQ